MRMMKPLKHVRPARLARLFVAGLSGLSGLALVHSGIAAEYAAPGGTVRGRVIVRAAKPDGLPTVVYLTGLEEPPPQEAARMQQRERKYTPEVLAITKGQEVLFSNDDKVVHNVFSMSGAGAFDLGEGKPGSQARYRFAKTGIIDLYCNIHSSMVANILVLPNRRYAYAQADGSFRIEGVPPGKYTVFAWHRMAKPAHQTVEVQAGTVVEAELNVHVEGELAPHLNKEGKPYPPKPEPRTSHYEY